MSCEFRIDTARRLGVFKCVDRLTVEEFFGCHDVVRGHPSFRKGLRYLVDLTEVRHHDPMPDAMFGRARMDLKAFEGELSAARMALVATRPHVYGMVRMYEILMQEARFPVRAFRDLGAARAWLGVPEVDGGHRAAS